MAETRILVAAQNDVAAVRVEGRATFKISRDLKRFCVDQLKAGVRSLIVDLSGCKGMDSTFMGVLAMVGLRGRGNSHLVLVNANAMHRDLLDGIAVSKVWTYAEETVENVNWTTLCTAAAGTADMDSVAPTMLAAHKTLMDLDPDNVPRFRDVVEMLESETD